LSTFGPASNRENGKYIHKRKPAAAPSAEIHCGREKAITTHLTQKQVFPCVSKGSIHSTGGRRAASGRGPGQPQVHFGGSPGPIRRTGAAGWVGNAAHPACNQAPRTKAPITRSRGFPET
jgi:hypothetical protein